jgi:short-subunit dehydrogenase
MTLNNRIDAGHEPGQRVAVFGASGGIGAALVAALAARSDVAEVFAVSRRAVAAGGKVSALEFDLGGEASIAAAAAAMAAGGAIDVCLVATGALTLEGTNGAGQVGPEKGWRMLDAAAMAEAYAINAIGPALIAKHMLPLLPRGRRGVFAALSARVGSIEDNRLGGWHSYRAAKAALNQLVRTMSIELARMRPEALAVTLHPGTVATDLSAPFQRGVLAERLFSPEQAAAQLLAVLYGLTSADSGGLFAWDGARIPY